MKTQIFFYSVIATILLTGLGNSFLHNLHANQHEDISYSGSINEFNLAVKVLPKTPVVGPIQFQILPTHISDNTPVEQAIIEVLVRKDEEAYMSRAVNTPKSPDTYIANLTLYQSGTWESEIRISTEPEIEHSVFFPIEVQGSNIHNEDFIASSSAGIFFMFIFGIIVIFTVFLSFRYKNKPQ